MLPKNRRILRKEFSSILSNGKRYNSTHLLLYTLPILSNEKAKQTKFSFSVSKKVCKSAAHRNKLRRQGYSIVSKHINKIKSGFLCFFSFKKNSLGVKFPVFEKEIVELLSAAFVLGFVLE